jgi:hypothetical protein
LTFEANQGQSDPQVNFLAHGPGALSGASGASSFPGCLPGGRGD